jgi:hypothetical protein
LLLPGQRASTEESEVVEQAERLKVYKRQDGKRTYVNAYTVSDIKELGDCDNIEAFIREHVVPVFGIGRYEITGIDARGQEFDAGWVIIEEHEETA